MSRQLAFRTRLTLAYTAIVAVAVVLLGTVAFETVRIALDTAFVTRLETTAKAIRSIVEVRRGRMEDLDGEDLEQFHALLGQGLNGAVLRGDGSLMSSNLAIPPTATLTSIAASQTANGIVHVDRGETVYVVLAIAERGTRYGTIVAWESRRTYDDAARITLLALAASGIVAIVAAAAAGGTLTRRMLRPVTELSAMISEIETTDLGERLAWDGPDDELGRLCATFDRLLDRLETAFARERRFIADASHELRTPLSVMRAEVELALMHERTPEAYRSTLVRLQRETQRLEALAQSLILTARDDAVSALSPVPLGAAAVRATSRMQPLATSRNIALTCAPALPVSIMGNAEMLERAIVALIDNALRFARTNVEVGVTLAGANAVITVTDDGPGFSVDALREATGRFWRDDPSRSGAGTGLGLAIVRSTVERHSGTIALRNAANGTGAVVILTVPAFLTAPP
jgi:two-component system OmpR family sensor kinase